MKPVCCVGQTGTFYGLTKGPKSNFPDRFATSTFTTSEVPSKGCKVSKNDVLSKKKCIPNLNANGANKQNGAVNGIVPALRNGTAFTSATIVAETIPIQSRSSNFTSVEELRSPVFSDCSSSDTYSSSILTFVVLLTLLLVQVTSTGIAPAIILEVFCSICLVGIFRYPIKHTGINDRAIS
jgi:hypothetical protein